MPISFQGLKTVLPYALNETHLPLPHKRAGKVRDAYPLDDEKILFVTTDRLSAFDRILACVPYKGQVLNQLAAWWFEQTREIVPNHALSIPDPNALVARAAEPFRVEVVVRGYITGVTTTALWHRYALGEREIYGYCFPDGLKKNQALPQPIVTPTTKGGAGAHDERLTSAQVVSEGYLDAATWYRIVDVALELFQRGQKIAKRAGLILVDTKYEFGRARDGTLLLIDEIHTPDSSRFWKADSYAACFENGAEPENFDKEFVRLAYAQKNYRGDGEPPNMPDDLWLQASERYITIYELLTGKNFDAGEYPIEPRLIENLRGILQTDVANGLQNG
ncbi:MAG: phosphoribosylaminoimidazolesuccinocarboxamide synthase [Chloroflexi bacterium UTCFX4]|jgi:phosphoribosylaminoimidazole-succinocarboxamide synthase|nr:MAG: phosphoribosylaminoimidazolesuccinocarboxamide synthase [Chloroflexi bacterium UTCFX4]